MQPHAVGGQAFDRRVEHRDVAFGDLAAEFVVGEVPVLVVARRTEIGRIDLQHKAGFDDGAVFDFEHLGERGEVGVLARIMQIDDKARQDAGRRRGHEHVRRLRLRRRGFEMGDVAVERGAVLVAQLADAAGKRHGGKSCGGRGQNPDDRADRGRS